MRIKRSQEKMILAGRALQQVEAEEDAEGTVPPALGAEQSTQAGYVLEEVTVTARKREENLQDIPISMAAFTGDGLEMRQIDGTDQLANAIWELTSQEDLQVAKRSLNSELSRLKNDGLIERVGSNEFQIVIEAEVDDGEEVEDRNDF